MGDKYVPVKGDRVRVVLEGEVRWASISGESRFDIGDDSYVRTADAVSIEKLEPPVEVFKPGDVVRHKDSGGLYTIAANGYISHRAADFTAWGFGVGVDFFTSKGYEKVSLG